MRDMDLGLNPTGTFGFWFSWTWKLKLLWWFVMCCSGWVSVLCLYTCGMLLEEPLGYRGGCCSRWLRERIFDNELPTDCGGTPPLNCNLSVYSSRVSIEFCSWSPCTAFSRSLLLLLTNSSSLFNSSIWAFALLSVCSVSIATSFLRLSTTSQF